ANVFVCRVSLTQGTHPEDSLREVLSALPWVGSDNYLEMRLGFLKTWALRDLAFSTESLTARSQQRATHAHFTGSLSYYGETIAAVQSITADQTRDFATRYLSSDRGRAVLVEPIAIGRAAPRAAPDLRRDATSAKNGVLEAPNLASLGAV